MIKIMKQLMALVLVVVLSFSFVPQPFAATLDIEDLPPFTDYTNISQYTDCEDLSCTVCEDLKSAAGSDYLPGLPDRTVIRHVQTSDSSTLFSMSVPRGDEQSREIIINPNTNEIMVLNPNKSKTQTHEQPKIQEEPVHEVFNANQPSLQNEEFDIFKDSVTFMIDQFDNRELLTTIILTENDSEMLKNGETIDVVKGTEAAPIIENGVFMVPLDMLVDNANAELSIDEDEDIILIIKDGEKTEINISTGKISHRDSQRQMRQNPSRRMGQVFVPLEDVAEILNYEVEQTDDTALLSRPFQTRRLTVKAMSEIDTYGAAAFVRGPGGLFVLQYETETQAQQAHEKLSGSNNVIFSEPDGVVRTTEYVPYSWGVERMSALPYQRHLMENIERLPDIIVGVLDTGIDPYHPFFDGRIIPNDYDYTSGTENSFDGHFHGTHVSGTIVDATLPNVKIQPYKVLDDGGSGSWLGVYFGIIDAVDNGVDVINMSLGGPGTSEMIYEAVMYAVENNVVVVVAAGNDSSDAANYSPAFIEEAITVSAADRYDNIAGFSNWGDVIDLAAAGVDVLAAVPGDRYESYSGTSMAAPHVAAAAAKLKTLNKGLSPQHIEAILRDIADDAGEPGFDIYFGDGILNLHRLPEVASAQSFNIVATPVLSHVSGWYRNNFELVITTETEGARIFYTTDGSAPTENSILYTGPILIEDSGRIRIRAFKDDYFSSAVVSRSYIVSPFPMTAHYTDMDYNMRWHYISDNPDIKAIKITFDERTDFIADGFDIHFLSRGLKLVDGSGEVITSAVSGIDLYSSTELAGKSYYFEGNNFAIEFRGNVTRDTFGFAVTEIEELSMPLTERPVFDQWESVFYETQKIITLTSPSPEAVIHYTTDGSMPTTNSSIYSGGITLTEPTIINAIAVEQGLVQSYAVSKTYYVSEFPQSLHYSRSMDLYMHFPSWQHPDNPDYLLVTFCEDTDFGDDGITHLGWIISRTIGENGCGFIELRDKYGNLVQNEIDDTYHYQDQQPAGRTIVVPGDTLNLMQFAWVTENTYGFKITDITPVFGVDSRVQKPEFSVTPAYYNTPQTMELTTDTAGADIYYTTDGTLPSVNSTLYTTPIQLSKTQTIRSVAIKDGLIDSSMVRGDYFISKFPASTHNNIFWEGFNISQIWEYEYPDSTVEALDLYFNIQTDFLYMQVIDSDGNEVFTAFAGREFSKAPIRVPGKKFSVVVDFGAGYFGRPSEPSSFYGFRIDNIVPINGVLSATPHSGTYDLPQTVTLTSTYPEVYFTLDGSEPDRTSTLYTGPINITQNNILRAVAFDGSSYSYIHETVYYITQPPESLHYTPGWNDASWEYDFSDLGMAIPVEVLFDENSQIENIHIYAERASEDGWGWQRNLPLEIPINQNGQPYLNVVSDYLNIQYLGGFSDGGEFGFKINDLNVPDVQRLDKPTINLTGAKLTWETCGNANRIRIFVNGNFRTDLCCCLFKQYYDLRFLDLPAGPHRIQIRTRDINGNFAMSELSEAVTFVSTREAPPQLPAPIVSIDGNTLIWNTIEGANLYSIFVNGTQRNWHWVDGETTANYNLSWLNLSNDTYQIQVRTEGQQGIANRSELSNTVTYVQNLPQLAAPSISLSGTRLTWQANNNATQLFLYVNGLRVGGCCCWLRLPSFDLRFLDLSSGSHQIRARFADSDGNFAISELSEAVTFVSTGEAPLQFSTPGVSIKGNTLTWNTIEGASTYSIFVNGVQSGWHGTSGGKTTSYNLSQLNLPNGTYQIRVRAEERYGFATNSELSNNLTYVQNLPKLTAPSISLDRTLLTWKAGRNANQLYIYVDGVRFGGCCCWFRLPYFDLRFLNLSSGTYQIQARVGSWDGNFAISDLSRAVTFVSAGEAPPQYQAPSISISGNNLRWDTIKGANWYSVYVNGTHKDWYWSNNKKTASYDLRRLNLFTGIYQIQVRTEEQYGMFGRSGLSNTVTFTVNKRAGAAMRAPAVNSVSRAPTMLTVSNIPAITPTRKNNPGGQIIQYAITTSTSRSMPATLVWQEGSTFTGLRPSTNYYIWARMGENDNYYAGTARRSEVIRTQAPVQAISLNRSGTQTIKAAQLGYTQATALSVRVNNTGSGASGALEVKLSGFDAGSFEISGAALQAENKLVSIAKGGNRLFSIRPVPGLGLGTYTAKVTVSGTDGSQAAEVSFVVSFTVNKRPGAALSSSVVLREASKTSDSITVTPPALPAVTNGQELEYAITTSTSNTVPSSGWQSSPVFPGLQSATDYRVWARMSANDEHNAGTARRSSVIRTLAEDYLVTLCRDSLFTFTPSRTFGAARPSQLTVTVNNKGQLPSGELSVRLTGDDAEHFTLGGNALQPGNKLLSIAGNAEGKGGSRTFTIRPNANLHVTGSPYIATVEVSGEDNEGVAYTRSFEVSFSVNGRGSGAKLLAAPGAMRTETTVTVTNGIAIFPTDNPGGQTEIQYAITTSNSSKMPSGLVWRTALPEDAVIFEDLRSNATYYIWARTASNDNCDTGTARRSGAVKTATPDHGIVLNRSGTHTFATTPLGNNPPLAATVTVSSRSRDSGVLTVKLTGDTHAFTLGGNASGGTLASIKKENSRNFNIRPVSGLDRGDYRATVEIGGLNGGTQFNVSFEVKYTVGLATGAPVNTIPSVKSVMADSIEVFPLLITGSNPGRQGVEYAVSTSSATSASAIAELTWQNGTVFEELQPSTTYYVFARSAGNENYNAGSVRRSVAIRTDVADYDFTLSRADHTFTTATEGYAAPPVHIVTISNTGKSPTGEITISIGGKDSTSFAVSLESIANPGIPAHSSRMFKVRPITGLDADAYEATITVRNADSSTIRTFDVSFIVNKASFPVVSGMPNLESAITPE